MLIIVILLMGYVIKPIIAILKMFNNTWRIKKSGFVMFS